MEVLAAIQEVLRVGVGMDKRDVAMLALEAGFTEKQLRKNEMNKLIRFSELIDNTSQPTLVMELLDAQNSYDAVLLAALEALPEGWEEIDEFRNFVASIPTLKILTDAMGTKSAIPFLKGWMSVRYKKVGAGDTA